jgi:hypothetical protein
MKHRVKNDVLKTVTLKTTVFRHVKLSFWYIRTDVTLEPATLMMESVGPSETSLHDLGYNRSVPEVSI